MLNPLSLQIGQTCTGKQINDWCRYQIENNGSHYTVAYVYQQFDGYLEGVGKSLCEWLLHKIMVNGIPDYEHDYANGMPDLAAQYVHEFKDGIGNLYLYAPNWSAEEACDYNYKVIHNFDINGNADDVLTIEVSSWGEEPFFVGKPSELLKFIEEHKEEDY